MGIVRSTERVIEDAANFVTAVEPMKKNLRMIKEFTQATKKTLAEMKKSKDNETSENLKEDLTLRAIGLAGIGGFTLMQASAVLGEVFCLGGLVLKTAGLEIRGSGSDWGMWYLKTLSARALFYGTTNLLYNAVKFFAGENYI